MTDPTQEGGAVEAFLIRAFGRSYRTTIAAMVGAMAFVVVHIPGVPAWLVSLGQIVVTASPLAGLAVAKDSRVSGRPS